MVSFIGFIFIYVIGGITFLPLTALLAFIYIKGGIKPWLPHLKKEKEAVIYKDPDNVIVKKGWVRLTNQYQPKMPEIQHHISNNSGIISGIQSYVGNKDTSGQQKKGVVYAVLKHGTLFCYESEKMKDVIMILPMQDYTVSLYPPCKPDKPEGALYGRTTVTRLVPNALMPIHDDINLTPSIVTLSEEDITTKPSRILYLTCARGIDKEDWYLGLLEAQHLLIDNEKDPQYVMMDNTHFDTSAMEELIRQVQSSPSHRETAWINAVFGRLFLAMYKTDRLKNFVEMKIRKKIDKTKRPTFLDEIKVRKVDVGESVPFITDPKLLSLSPEGEVVIEAKVEYHGGLAIEIETDFNWSYSSLMKPIRMHLILSVKLKSMSGRMMLKLKAPPTNRYWLAFFEMPEMEWKITPVVADKQIKLAIVTNAIESRIREVMAETFVLPNMDDTSFCPSGGKGGIFGEYVKVKRKKSKEPSYVNEDKEDSSSSVKHSRESSVSSEHSRYRETPTVPDQNEKPSAADVLKLKNRRAESATEFAISGNTTNDSKHDLDSQKFEMSKSTPDLLLKHDSSAVQQSYSSDDNESIHSSDQQSIAESTTTSSTSAKWSNTSNYIRKRMMKASGSDVGEDHTSDMDSIKTNHSTLSNNNNNSGGSGFLSKVARLLPTDSLPPSSDSKISRSDTQTSTSSTNSNKRNSLIHMAENLLTKKNGNSHNNEPMNEEKRGVYAERLANMRKRAEEKISAISSGASNNSSIRSPPPLPPVSSARSSFSATTSQKPVSPTTTKPSQSLLDDDSYQALETNSNLPQPITPTMSGRATSIDSSKSLLDDDSEYNQDLQLPLKPTQERDSSAVHQDSTSNVLPVDDSSLRQSIPQVLKPDDTSDSNIILEEENVITEPPKKISNDDDKINVEPTVVSKDDTIPEPALHEETIKEPVQKEEVKSNTLLPSLPDKPRPPPLPTSPRPKIPSSFNTTTEPPPSYQDGNTPKPVVPPRENHDAPLSPPPVPPRHT